MGNLGAGRPRPCPPPHAAFRTLCPQAGQSVRSEAHYAAAVPRLVRPAPGGGPGKTGESAALPGRLSRCPGGAVAWAVWARGGRVPVRRRTRRFGHFALKPGKVFAPRRTTRRQCRGLFGRRRAAGRAKRGRAPPFRAGCLVVRAALWHGRFGRGVAASLSAAARGVSDTLPSSRAKCSLRGALRGGSAAACSACAGRRAGQNGGERRPASLPAPACIFWLGVYNTIP